MQKDSIVIQAERIASEFLQEQAKASYSILDKGITNQICVVETENHTVVVRMNDKDTYQDFIKEKWCIEQATAVGIPSPGVLSVGITDEIAYMIQTFIPGDNGVDSSVSKSDAWRQLGEYAKLIHSIPVEGYGKDLADPVQGVFQSPSHEGSDGSWQGFVQYNINSLTDDDRLIELGVITQLESQKIRKLFENFKKASLQFGLNHGDISLKNTIINKEGQVSLLDWGNAEVTVIPHGTIIQLMHYQILGLAEAPSLDEFKAFLNGYGLNEEDDFTEMRELLLLKAFDNLRWAIDCSPDLIESYAAFAKKVVDMIMEDEEL